MVAGGTSNGRRRAAVVVLVVVVVLVALAAAAGAILKARTDARMAQSAAAQYTPPPLKDPSPAARPIVAVVGDDSTTAAARGVTAAQRWTAQVASAQSVDVQTFASAGASYLAKGTDGRTFVDEAARVPRNAAIIIIFGGARDAVAAPLSVSRAASQTISAAQSRAPQAVLVVVGPLVSGGANATAITQLRTNLQNVAGAFQIRFADPVQQAWLNSAPAAGSSLTVQDEQVLAARFGTIVAQLLPAQ